VIDQPSMSGVEEIVAMLAQIMTMPSSSPCGAVCGPGCWSHCDLPVSAVRDQPLRAKLWAAQLLTSGKAGPRIQAALSLFAAFPAIDQLTIKHEERIGLIQAIFSSSSTEARHVIRVGKPSA
jgi:hypothetical protein